MYKERELTQRERSLAATIRENFEDSYTRLMIASDVAAIAEHTRDAAWEHMQGHNQEAWDAMHFPRYRFFSEAVAPFWNAFAEWDREPVHHK